MLARRAVLVDAHTAGRQLAHALEDALWRHRAPEGEYLAKPVRVEGAGNRLISSEGRFHLAREVETSPMLAVVQSADTDAGAREHAALLGRALLARGGQAEEGGPRGRLPPALPGPMARTAAV